MTSWASGACPFKIAEELDNHTLIVGVTCRFGSLATLQTALLDTGAQYSVVGGSLFDEIERDLGEPIMPFIMATRFGRLNGHLRNLTLELVATEGRALRMDATVFAARDWRGPPVIGYFGCLERVRFALDPGVGPDAQRFYFGSADEPSIIADFALT